MWPDLMQTKWIQYSDDNTDFHLQYLGSQREGLFPAHGDTFVLVFAGGGDFAGCWFPRGGFAATGRGV